MTTMISEVYDALIAGSVPEEKARKAAEALSNYEDRFNRVDIHLVRHDGDLLLLKWMLGFNLAFTVAILAKLVL